MEENDGESHIIRSLYVEVCSLIIDMITFGSGGKFIFAWGQITLTLSIDTWH